MAKRKNVDPIICFEITAKDPIKPEVLYHHKTTLTVETEYWNTLSEVEKNEFILHLSETSFVLFQKEHPNLIMVDEVISYDEDLTTLDDGDIHNFFQEKYSNIISEVETFKD